MNRRCFLFFLTVSLLFPVLLYSQDLNTFSLNGNWKFRRAGSHEWMPAKVPGVVHLDLMRNRKIPDPFVGNNEEKLQWIGRIGWEYSKTFEFGAGNFAWRHIELVCKGLDTYANVYLNDSLILVADNMFREWTVDIKQRLHVGTNTLRIQFPAVTAEDSVRYSQLPAKLPGDEKVVCRKAACHFGWDWGPVFLTSGIWRPIYIRKYGALNVKDVHIIQKELTDSVATLSAEFNMSAELDNPCEIKLFLDSTVVMRDTLVLKRGVNIIRGDIKLRDPERWWPNGMGPQKLYNFRYEILYNGELVARGNKSVGLRTLELVRDQDSTGRSFYFRINGLPVFVKGANYIPQDNFLPRVTDSTYRALIRDAKDAGINMLRVWGGGIYENDVFYDLCDENGIMVWQDFMFACAMYPGNRKFLDNISGEAIQNVVRLRQHPCIALWCGNNEIDEGWKNWGWQKQYGYSPGDSARIYRDYRLIFNAILPGIVQSFDTLRPYIPTSPMYGWGHTESMKEGDSHYWGVWWGKEPFSVYRNKTGRFMSEYGFQGFPPMTTIRKFADPDDCRLDSPVMRSHQKHPVGYETIEEYMQRDYRKPKDFESYVYVSQLLQASGMKEAIEAHRRAKPLCMGTMFWQLNDCWPVVSWSSRDYYGGRKAFYYALSHLYSKVMVSPVTEEGHIRVYVSSDEVESQKSSVTMKLMDFSGKEYFKKVVTADIPGNGNKICFDTLQSALIGGLDPKELVFSVNLEGTATGSGATGDHNLLYFAPPKDLHLPVPEITKTVAETPGGYVVRIVSNRLAKNLFLSATESGTFSDNYFDLLPGVPVEVVFRTPVKIADMSSRIILKSLVDTYDPISKP